MTHQRALRGPAPTFQTLFVAGLVALLFAALPASAADLWFHISVEDRENDNANITVNLPVSMVETALSMVDDESMRHGHIVIEDTEFDAAKLRQMWNDVKDSPDMTFVTVQSDTENIKVYKQGGYLMARTDDRGSQGAQVNARIPLAVVDALLSTDDNTLNLQAALRALVDHGDGELVTVSEGASSVRVWIDTNPEMAR